MDESFREIPSPVGIDDRQAWLSDFMKQEWSEQSPDITAWRERAWSKLFECEQHTAIFTHFMIINSICCQLTGNPETLFEGDYLMANGGPNYDVSPDGEQFLMIRAVESASVRPDIVIVLNWFEELDRLAPVSE